MSRSSPVGSGSGRRFFGSSFRENTDSKASPNLTAQMNSTEPVSMANPLNKNSARAIQAANKARADKARSVKHSDAAAQLRSKKAIPVRDALQAVYKIYRDRKAREALYFLLFVAMFLGITQNVVDVQVEFGSNNALMDLLLDEEFPGTQYKKNFFEIMTQQEVWAWLQGPMLNGLYPTQYYNGEKFNNDSTGYTLSYFRLVGQMRLRQVRVGRESCEVRRFADQTARHINPVTGVADSMGRYDTLDGTCFSEWAKDTQETTPFTKCAYDPVAQTTTSNCTTYFFERGQSELNGLFGYHGSYGHGGYTAYLPQDRAGASAVLERMKAERWIDRGTRAVSLDFNLYNTNTRMATNGRLVFELFRTGLIVRQAWFYTWRVSPYESLTDQGRVLLEIVFLIAWASYLKGEIARVARAKNKFAKLFSFRTLFEVGLLAGAFWYMVSWVAVVVQTVWRDFDVNDTEYRDLYDIGEAYVSTFSIGGFVGLLMALKMFKFLGVSKNMVAIWLTLRRAVTDIVSFAVGFVVLVGGFAWTGWLFFGFAMSEFHNYQSSFSTLLRFPLGDFDYGLLSRTRPRMAGLFFSLYVGMVFLVLLNMFIGILTEYFDEVHDDLKTTDRWKDTVPTYASMIREKYLLPCWYKRCKRGRIFMCCADDLAKQQGWSGRHRASTSGVLRPPAPGGAATNKPNPVDIELGRPQSFSRSRAASAAGKGELPPGVVRESVLDSEGLEAASETQAVDEHLTYIENLNLFYKQMERCYVLASRRNDLDLFHYLEKLYENQRDTDSMYITDTELSYLIGSANRMQLSRSRSSVIPPDEDALKLVELFHELHDVEMMGAVRRHVPAYEKFLKRQKESFTATKVNTHGVRQKRYLWIDKEAKMLYNFDKNLRLKKKLPLVQLVQVEAPQAFPRMLTLVFSSAGIDRAILDDDVLDNLETTYRLDFRSKRDSDEFSRVLLNLCETIPRFEDIIMNEEENYYKGVDEEGDGEGGGDVATAGEPGRSAPGITPLSSPRDQKAAPPGVVAGEAKRKARASILVGSNLGLSLGSAVRMKGFASRARGRASMAAGTKTAVNPIHQPPPQSGGGGGQGPAHSAAAHMVKRRSLVGLGPSPVSPRGVTAGNPLNRLSGVVEGAHGDDEDEDDDGEEGGGSEPASTAARGGGTAPRVARPSRFGRMALVLSDGEGGEGGGSDGIEATAAAGDSDDVEAAREEDDFFGVEDSSDEGEAEEVEAHNEEEGGEAEDEGEWEGEYDYEGAAEEGEYDYDAEEGQWGEEGEWPEEEEGVNASGSDSEAEDDSLFM